MIKIFIVNQDGDRCEKVDKLWYELNYDDETLGALKEINDRLYAKVYNWGSTENCLNAIKREQSEYLTYNKCKKIIRIYVNGNQFAIFKDMFRGMKVFDEILDCLKENGNLFNLSEKKYWEVETSKN